MRNLRIRLLGLWFNLEPSPLVITRRAVPEIGLAVKSFVEISLSDQPQYLKFKRTIDDSVSVFFAEIEEGTWEGFLDGEILKFRISKKDLEANLSKQMKEQYALLRVSNDDDDDRSLYEVRKRDDEEKIREISVSGDLVGIINGETGQMEYVMPKQVIKKRTPLYIRLP